ncbi:MAG: coproporphyrinogen III oxidase family protein [Acidobacteria bacterium]|nr:MAG: coproporphyrinogen III oxidase family protein [Acidobacteriota bacterium]
MSEHGSRDARPAVAGRPPAPHLARPKGTEVGSVFVSNYPPFSVWSREHLAAYEAVLERPWDPTTSPSLGLYLHIPFCRKRCKFCYFRVYTDKNAEQIQTYLDALAREVELYAERPAFAGRPLDFVYFGGGTPSYVAVKHLEGLVARLQAAMPWRRAQEITFECEPGTLTAAKVEAIRAIGVTRLSLGVEHFDDEVLRENGRAHVSKEIYRCLPWIRAAGFDQLNVDLIAGMVGDDWPTWKETVEKTVELDPDSVTIYQMELPYNTVYSQAVLKGEPSPVADWPTKRAWHGYAIDRLQEAGYEISSAYTMVKKRPGNDASGRFLYRDALWHGSDLLGCGVASFGHVAGVHAQNQADWHGYLEPLLESRLPLGRALATSPRQRLTRELILQLKLGRLDLAPLSARHGIDVRATFAAAFAELERRGMLRLDGDRVELSRQGLLQVDALLPHFYEEPYRHARYT